MSYIYLDFTTEDKNTVHAAFKLLPEDVQPLAQSVKIRFDDHETYLKYLIEQNKGELSLSIFEEVDKRYGKKAVSVHYDLSAKTVHFHNSVKKFADYRELMFLMLFHEILCAHKVSKGEKVNETLIDRIYAVFANGSDSKKAEALCPLLQAEYDKFHAYLQALKSRFANLQLK